MTDTEKLRLIIERVVENGWVHPPITDEGKMHYTDTGIVVEWKRGGGATYPADTIFFDKGFAQALWGTGGVWDGRAVVSGKLDAWEYHLQQLVLADDRIDYVYRSINGK